MQSENFDQQVAILINGAALRGRAFNLTGDIVEAKDLLQDSALKALRYKHLFKPGSNLGAWLNTIIRNTHFNKRLAIRRLPTRSAADPNKLHNEYVTTPEAYIKADREYLGLRLKQMGKVIAGLPERNKSVVDFHLQGKNAPQIAEIQGIKKKAVYYLVKESKAIIRQKMT